MNLSRISSGPVLGLISGYIFNSVVNRAWEILSNSSLNDFDFPKSTIITICIATTFFAIIATFYWINLREHKPHSDFLLSTIGKKEIPQELQEPVALGFDDPDFRAHLKKNKDLIKAIQLSIESSLLIINRGTIKPKITIYLNYSAHKDTSFYIRGDACSLDWNKENAQKLTFVKENQWKWETNAPDKKFSFKFLQENDVWEKNRWNNELTCDDCKVNPDRYYSPQF